MSNRLIAIDLPGGAAFVERLERAWSEGDAILPVDVRLPTDAKLALLERLRPHVVVDAHGERTWRSAEAAVSPVDVADGDAAVIATSGTTGDPKGVVLTHDAIAASATASDRRLGTSATDHWLACLPLSHVGGLSVIFRALHGGTALTVLPRFDAEPVTEAARAGANLVSLVPTALDRIEPALFDTILLGGSAAPTQRPANTVTTYGMTETGSGVVYDRLPLDGVELRIVGGEVEVRGPMLFRCYRGSSPTPDTAADGDGGTPFAGTPFEWSPIGGDGWFRTGDLGTIHDDGTLEVFGRNGDLIITGGENVWPSPVETVIAAMPQVGDVIVAGRKDNEWGEIVVAHIVPASDDPVELDEIRDAVKAVLPPYCAPRALVIHKTLPRTALGKPQRHQLPNR